MTPTTGTVGEYCQTRRRLQKASFFVPFHHNIIIDNLPVLLTVIDHKSVFYSIWYELYIAADIFQKLDDFP